MLHAELAGKLLATNKRKAIRIRKAMLQVDAAMKMLDPAVNRRAIYAEYQFIRNL